MWTKQAAIDGIARGQVREKPCGEIVLYNGRIATMDVVRDPERLAGVRL